VRQCDGRNVVTRETYVIFLMRAEDPGMISKRLRRRRPVLLRRQTLSMPDDWPHPRELVGEVLRTTGLAPDLYEGDEEDSLEMSPPPKKPKLVDDGVGEPASPRKQTCLHDFFSVKSRSSEATAGAQ